MSAKEAIQEAYLKLTPKWVKAIRWRDWGDRIVKKQILLSYLVYGPVLGVYYFDTHRWLYEVFLRRPKTHEEVLLLKQNYMRNEPYRRDWAINEYDYDNPPLYDMTRRRLNYPEHYQGRYETKKIPNAWGEIREVRNKYLPPKEEIDNKN